MSGKRRKAGPRAYARLTRHERDTIQRMLERGRSCREIARELGRSPSTVSAEVASRRFVTAPRERHNERVDGYADLSAARPRLAGWPRCCNGCGRYRAIGCRRRPHAFYDARAAQLCADSVLVSSRREARRDTGLPAARPLARADVRAQRRARRPLALDHLPLDRRRLRRHDQHGAQAQGRLQARRRAAARSGTAFRPQVARLVRGPFGGRARRGVGDVHGGGVESRRDLHPDPAAPPEQRSQLYLPLRGKDTARPLDACSVEEVPLTELDLTPALIERARAERDRRSMATESIETHFRCSFNWENDGPGPRKADPGRSTGCGNGLLDRSVRLRLKISLSPYPSFFRTETQGVYRRI